jgi:dihydropyrimidinase
VFRIRECAKKGNNEVSVDTVVRNGIVVTPGGSFAGGVAVDGGKIVAVGNDQALPEGRDVIDAKGQYITPGFIDTHTHQGLFHPFQSEIMGQSYLAAIGGVTTFIGTDKSTRLGQEFKEFSERADIIPYHDIYSTARAAVDANSYVDFALTFACLTDEHALEIPSIVEDLGVTSFKFYIGSLSGDADRWSAKLGSPSAGFDDGTMYLGFEQIGKVGRPAMAMIHAENRPVMRIFWDRAASTGDDYAALAATCPGFVEALDIRRAALIAKETDATLYVVHLTSREGLEAVEMSRREGTKVLAEVCLPWVTTRHSDDPPGIWGKVLPPLRDSETLDALWQGLNDGRIQCIGTDSVSMSRQLKATMARTTAELNAQEGKVSRMASAPPRPGEPLTIWSVGVGWTVLSSFVPALITYGVKRGRVSIERLVEVACENNARAFGLYPRKGTLQVGADADLNVISLDEARKPVPSRLLEDESETEYNLYETEDLFGWPSLTMVRGTVVARHGRVTGPVGHGRLIERKFQGSYPWTPRPVSAPDASLRIRS